MDISKIITHVLKDFNNNQYHETNPIGKIIDAFEEKGVKAESEFPVPSVDYNKTEKVNLIIEGHNNKVLVNLYRMDSGRYEVNAYEVVLSNKVRSRNKARP